MKLEDIGVLPGLEKFIDRLEPGQRLPARIVDKLDAHVFILRIWGYNMLAESPHTFQRGDEVILAVKQTSPKLVFTLQPVTKAPGAGLYA